ncbi:MAG TPA: hypothetical protein VKX39_07365 [Bryobacteraceae bacterium]|jgi:hypothetical protein|nr:hypothetical protein [Bryobacteraceae bacterium]
MRARRLAAAAAILGLAAIVSGALLTSIGVSLQPGQAAPRPDAHRVIAITAIALVIAAIVWGRSRAALSGALLALLASAAVGWNFPLSPAAAVAHAALAHLFTAAIALALIGAPARAKDPIAAGPFAALRPASLWAPPAVFTQIVMGALYRHQITGIMPHMLGAMAVALLTIVISAILLQNFSASKPLRRAAIALMTAVLVQICFGIAVFLLLLLNAGDTQAFLWLATAHVATGTLVLAASILTAIEVRRNLA